MKHISAALLATTLLGCTVLGEAGPAFDAKHYRGNRAPDGAPTVLVVLTPSDATHEVLSSLTDELSSDLGVSVLPVVDGVGVAALRDRIDQVHPACIVLMNNATVNLYRAYQRAQPPDSRFPPAIVVMASYLEELRIGMRNTTGIAYEVPAVTIFRNLRAMLNRPVARVGVVYRAPFSHFIERQRLLAAEENIEFVGVRLPTEPTPWELQDAILALREEHTVDALWVLNDNRLLGAPEMYAYGWQVALEDEPLPMVVGVSSLVSPDRTFGAFAMIPDHAALGVQAANLVFGLFDEQWVLPRDAPVQPPLSVRTVVDLRFARRYLSFKEEMLGRIDRVVE